MVVNQSYKLLSASLCQCMVQSQAPELESLAISGEVPVLTYAGAQRAHQSVGLKHFKHTAFLHIVLVFSSDKNIYH